MGEAMVAYGFAAELKREFADCEIVFTSTHPDVIAGMRRRGLAAQTAYFPLDTPVGMQRIFERWHPRAVFVSETDFWPEFSTQCRQRRIPLYLINGRISSKIAAFYAHCPGLAEVVFSAYSLLAVQTDSDASRLLAIGVAPEHIAVLGNMKADLTIAPGSVDLSAFIAWIAGRRAVVMGSLHPGEFNMLLPVIKSQAAAGRAVIVAPRNPAFAAEWQQILFKHDVKSSLRSQGLASAQVLLLDSMGELAAVYSLAGAALVGGSLDGDVGGHNPLEVIQQSVPLLMGLNCRNFADLVAELAAAEAMISCRDGEDVENSVNRLLADSDFASAMIARAAAVLAANRGALARTMRLIAARLR
jgi:3-deoxy-D-manno-octulosonic-acid transferase